MSHNARAASQTNTDNRIPDWSGTNDLLGVWLYELKRARPLFSSAIQTFAKTGTSVNNRGVTLVRSEEHALLLIRCPHILSEYNISNPFPNLTWDASTFNPLLLSVEILRQEH